MYFNLLRLSKAAGPVVFLLLSFLQYVEAASPVWQIQNGKNTTYLAGTVHILRKSDYPLPAAFERAYQQSKILTFEVDIAQSQGPEFNRAMLQSSLLPQGQTLQGLLTAETYQQLLDYLKHNNLSIEQFKGLKPSMLAITLTMLELQKLGAGDQGVDEHYFSKATIDAKTIEALESIQQQIDFISTMGQGMEDEMIRQTLDEIATLQNEFGEMVQSWRQGNREKLEDLFVKPMRDDFEPMYQQLLVQRNQNWMPRIRQYLQTPETEMILVGSAHLLGPDGLLQQLEKAGYRISQLD